MAKEVIGKVKYKKPINLDKRTYTVRHIKP
jgi:hypothetical protein